MRFFWLFFSLVSSFSALGSEGFSTDFSFAPLSVQAWKDRVFMVYSEDRQQPVGTAFLVHNDGSNAYLVTAAHVLKHCNPPAKCTLHHDANWKISENGASLSSKYSLQIQDSISFDRSAQNWHHNLVDIGMMKAASFPELPKANITNLGKSIRPPLLLGGPYAEKHFILGYPFIPSRTSLEQEANANEVKLRWSEGDGVQVSPRKEIISFLTPTSPEPRYVGFILKTNADSLGGNSGGPVLTENGQLIGVLYGGPITSQGRYSDWNSHVVPIDKVRRLVGDVLLGRTQFKTACEDVFLGFAGN